ncbi:hypothetical protein ACQP2P_16625 [Dactylosporangium sp. CA-139114]|uniref:hypothetical protein n=1 Tax=Dactylosporangium sp. CA-139114 TaxID=3239931 RepID=UPI003D972563
MTRTVPALIPSAAPPPLLRHPPLAAQQRVLPMPPLQPRRSRSTVYGFAAVDKAGRITGSTVFRALGWPPHTRLQVREDHGFVLVRRDPCGVLSLNEAGHLHLLEPVRRWCDLRPGDRVLLAAEPDRQLLVIHPPAALDAMITRAHEVIGGDAA